MEICHTLQLGNFIDWAFWQNNSPAWWGAIGTILAAIATFWAVKVSVSTVKPNIKLSAQFENFLDVDNKGAFIQTPLKLVIELNNLKTNPLFGYAALSMRSYGFLDDIDVFFHLGNGNIHGKQIDMQALNTKKLVFNLEPKPINMTISSKFSKPSVLRNLWLLVSSKKYFLVQLKLGDAYSFYTRVFFSNTNFYKKKATIENLYNILSRVDVAKHPSVAPLLKNKK